MTDSITITHHELELIVQPIGRSNPYTPLTNISILDVFETIKNLNYETKTRMFGNSRFCGILPVINIDRTNNRVDLILTLSDKDADDQIVRDFDNTNNVRALTRSATEGVDHRTHIVVKQDDKYPKTAYFALEYKAGLTPRFLRDTLNYFVKDISSHTPSLFVGNHPTEQDAQGQPKQVNMKLKFAHSSALSEEIIEAFAKGRVNNVIFEETVLNPQSFDPTGNFIQHKRMVYLDVAGNIVDRNATTLSKKRKNIVSKFNNMIGRHPNLKGIKFTIKFENANRQPQTAYYDSATQEFSLAKKTYIESSIRQRATATPTINQALCDRMFAHI